MGSSDKTIKQWNHKGVCLQTFVTGNVVESLVVWNDSLYSGSGNKIKQWVAEDEEYKAKKMSVLYELNALEKAINPAGVNLAAKCKSHELGTFEDVYTTTNAELSRNIDFLIHEIRNPSIFDRLIKQLDEIDFGIVSTNQT